MLSVIDQGASAPCPAPFNLAAHVLARAEAQRDRIALQILRPDGAERWSYGRLTDAVRGIGTGLLRSGLRPGDRVLLRLGNGVEFPLAFLGSIAAGLIPVPSSAQLTVPEVDRIAALVEPRLILAGEGLALPSAPGAVMTSARMMELAAEPPCDFAMGDPDRLAYMVFTSGTSGRVQAVRHAHRAIWARRMMHADWMGLTESDRLLHPGAFNWTYTLGAGLLDPWTVGATALIPGPGVGPEQLPLLMKRFDATILAAAPGVYRQMLRTALPALPRLRHGLSAGEALPQAIRTAWEAATGTPIFEAYGLSECSTFISGAPHRPAPAGATGYAQGGRRIAVLAGGRPVPRGEPGVIAVHRSDPGLFLGYPGAEIPKAEWFETGDLGRMAEDGAITYLGRADDMMNAGGYRVSPVEVEEAMLRHPAIRDCAATELRVKSDATVIACFYTSAERLEEAELAAHARAFLARYKQPRLFLAVESLPRNANNKLMRRRLRQEWEAAHGPT